MKMTDAIVNEIAEEADADPRTVIRALAGLPVRGRAGKRVEQALKKRGLIREPQVRSQRSPVIPGWQPLDDPSWPRI